jgi:hypothetical protein
MAPAPMSVQQGGKLVRSFIPVSSFIFPFREPASGANPLVIKSNAWALVADHASFTEFNFFGPGLFVYGLGFVPDALFDLWAPEFLHLSGPSTRKPTIAPPQRTMKIMIINRISQHRHTIG